MYYGDGEWLYVPAKAKGKGKTRMAWGSGNGGFAGGKPPAGGGGGKGKGKNKGKGFDDNDKKKLVCGKCEGWRWKHLAGDKCKCGGQWKKDGDKPAGGAPPKEPAKEVPKGGKQADVEAIIAATLELFSKTLGDKIDAKQFETLLRGQLPAKAEIQKSDQQLYTQSRIEVEKADQEFNKADKQWQQSVRTTKELKEKLAKAEEDEKEKVSSREKALAAKTAAMEKHAVRHPQPAVPKPEPVASSGKGVTGGAGVQAGHVKDGKGGAGGGKGASPPVIAPLHIPPVDTVDKDEGEGARAKSRSPRRRKGADQPQEEPQGAAENPFKFGVTQVELENMGEKQKKLWTELMQEVELEREVKRKKTMDERNKDEDMENPEDDEDEKKNGASALSEQEKKVEQLKQEATRLAATAAATVVATLGATA